MITVLFRTLVIYLSLIAIMLGQQVLLFIIGCEFFINYKINFRKRSKGGNE